MDNFLKITSSEQLDKVFENANDKLVVLMFFTKNNKECRIAQSSFEKSALNHTISFFCFVDMDKFKGESRYINNVNNMPKFDFYYNGNQFFSHGSCIDKEIEQHVRHGEQYVMTQNNNKNSMPGQNGMLGQNNMPGQINQINQINQMNQMNQINPMQIQQQILNNAQMQNATYFQYLMQNPMVLRNLVQKQIESLQQQQMMAQQMMPQQNQMQQMMAQQMMSQQNQMPNITTPQQIPSLTTTPFGNMPQPNYATPQLNSTNNILPTFQQMQQMFQIFQMMQQMGILNTQNTQNTPQPNVSIQNQTESIKPIVPAEPDNTIVLPNGDKVIPLPNGKFGLIKKLTN